MPLRTIELKLLRGRIIDLLEDHYPNATDIQTISAFLEKLHKKKKDIYKELKFLEQNLYLIEEKHEIPVDMEEFFGAHITYQLTAEGHLLGTREKRDEYITFSKKDMS